MEFEEQPIYQIITEIKGSNRPGGEICVRTTIMFGLEVTEKYMD